MKTTQKNNSKNKDNKISFKSTQSNSSSILSNFIKIDNVEKKSKD